MKVRSSQDESGLGQADRYSGRLRLLAETGLLLASERDPRAIAQAALDAGLTLCGAACGAAYCPNFGVKGEALWLRSGSGSQSEDITETAIIRLPKGFVLPSSDQTVVTSEDITADFDPARSALVQALLPEPASLRSYLEIRMRSRDGELLGVLLYGHPDRGVFQQDAEDLVRAVAAQAAMALDVVRLTESLRREAEAVEAAREGQRSTDKRLRLALDATRSGIWTWHIETGMIDLDERAAALFGVSAYQPISRADLRIQSVYPEDLESSVENLAQVVETGIAYHTEYRIRQPDGELRWVASNGVPDVDQATGVVLGLTGTVQDISSRKAQEEALRQSETLAATGRLAATIAHEINNPLEAVTNLIYLAKTDPAAPPALSKLLETADAELARVSHIAQQTLGFYRDTTRPVAIDVNELLGAVVDLFARKLAGKHLNVKLDLEPGLSMVGLQGEIRQVVSNLLVNAIDASPPSGAIRIRGRHRRCNGTSGISVLICDLGAGIPQHLHRQLFTPFVTTKHSRGTGLGLWVTRGMVEKHGGTVRFRSRVITPAGTVFRVYLPQTSPGHIFDSQTSAVLQ